MSLNFKNAIPQSMVMQKPVSTSKAVLRKAYAEMLPTEQSTYSPTGNNIIRFNIASRSDFLIGEESYFRWKLKRTEGSAYDNNAALDVGGCHALIRSVEVRDLATGNLFQRYDNYNKWYALKSQILQSRLNTEYNSWMSGDSICSQPHFDAFNCEERNVVATGLDRIAGTALTSSGSTGRARSEITIGDSILVTPVALTYATADYDLAGGATYNARQLTFTGSNVASSLIVGTQLQIYVVSGNAAGNFTVRVDAINGQVIQLSAAEALPDDFSNAQLGFVKKTAVSDLFAVVSVTDNDTVVVNRPYEYADATLAGPVTVTRLNGGASMQTAPARQVAVQTSGTDRILEFQLNVTSLLSNLPLFLMPNGIEVQLELELADRAMSSGLDLEDSTTAMSYEISTPRFFAMLATPHPDIVNEYVAAYRSDEGLIFRMDSVRTRRVTGNAAEQNTNLNIHFGLRGVRRVYAIVQDSVLAEGTVGATRAVNSISLCHRTNINQFQFKIGSHEFPNRPVVCDVYSTEAAQQLLQVSQSRHYRFKPSDWYSINTIKTGAATQCTAESTFWCMAADFSRDTGSMGGLSGSDASHVPIDLDIERSATYNSDGLQGNPVYYVFAEHDSYLKLSAAQVAVLN